MAFKIRQAEKAKGDPDTEFWLEKEDDDIYLKVKKEDDDDDDSWIIFVICPGRPVEPYQSIPDDLGFPVTSAGRIKIGR